MVEINENYEQEIRSIINKFGSHWRKSLEAKNEKSKTLLNYVLARTSFLDTIETNLKTRVVCCLKHIKEIPKCKCCGKTLSKYFIDNVIEENPRETMFCSHKCVYKAREKSDPHIYFERQYPTKESKIAFLKKLLEKYPLTYQRVLQGKDYLDVTKWIYNAVPKLQDKCYNIATRLYWILNGLNDFPSCHCQKCNNKIGIGKNVKTTVGYNKYCSRQCAAKSDLTKQHLKEAFIEKYGVDNPSKFQKVLDKIANTTLKHHGVKCLLTTQKCRELGKNALKEKAIEISRQRLEAKRKHQEYIKSTLIGSSMQEDQIRIWLENAFGKNDILTHYTSSEYPFSCDFYIKSKNLYIEYLGLWTHGRHAFDKNNQDDLNLLEKMKAKNSKFYDNAVYVWTDLDPRKRKIAKENNLNYLELWDMNEVADWISKNSQEKVPFASLLKYKFKKCIFNPFLISQNN